MVLANANANLMEINFLQVNYIQMHIKIALAPSVLAFSMNDVISTLNIARECHVDRASVVLDYVDFGSRCIPGDVRRVPVYMYIGEQCIYEYVLYNTL